MRIFLFLLSCLISLSCYSQDKNVRVILKNGTAITGSIKELVVNDHVTLSVAGVDTVVPMAEVKDINDTTSSNDQSKGSNQLGSGKYGAYIITDKETRPDYFTLTLNGENIDMILVRGGSFNMGYDDRWSISMMTEPIHRVTLSSYYISKECIPLSLAEKLLTGDKKVGKHSVDDLYAFSINTDYMKIKVGKHSVGDLYATNVWDKADKLVSEIASEAKKPYRLPTEAEWEYVALTPLAEQLFTAGPSNGEWCSDYLGEYTAAPQLNPVGPAYGKEHVSRSYYGRRNMWDREKGKNDKACLVRIVIDADKIK